MGGELRQDLLEVAVVDVAGSPLLDALVFELCAEHHHGSPLRPPAPLRARADQDLLRAVAAQRGGRRTFPRGVKTTDDDE